MIIRFQFALILLAIAANGAAVMPADRQIDWSQAGIPGGIPSRTTVFTNLGAVLDTSGTTDSYPLIQWALNNCPGNQVVVLPAGHLRLNTPISLVSWKVLRGAGMNQTALVSYAGDGINGYWPYWYWGTAYLAPAAQGASNLVFTVLPDVPLQVGYKVMVDEVNSAERSVIAGGIEGGPGEYAMGQISEITAYSGSNITIWPPLVVALTNSPRLRFPGNPTTENLVVHAGVEDLTITNAIGAGADAIIDLTGVAYSWFKNVRTLNGSVSHVRMEYCFRNNFLGCESRGIAPPYTSGRNYGMQIGSGPPTLKTSFNRIEDFIWEGTRPGPVIGYGAAGNVFGYNLLTNIHSNDPTNAMKAAIIVHSAHPQMNLFEGNVGNAFMADFFHGSSSHQVLFRNWFYGSESWTTSSRKSIEIDTTNRYYTAVGNILGKPGLTGLAETIAPAESSYDIYKAWMLGYVGEGGMSEYTPIPGGTTYVWDPVAISSLFRHGNYVYLDDTTTWTDGYSQTLPASLYLTAAPNWWGTNAWPAIGPDVSGYTQPIPAEVRYLTGYTPPPQGEPEPEPTPSTSASGITGSGFIEASGIIN